jgi:adenylate cyclase
VKNKLRIPITTITVFGTSLLLLLTVGISLYLGFSQAAETTRQLWADQSETLINGLEKSLESRLVPIRDQALWIADEIHDLSNPADFDSFIFGTLAATPHVAGIAVISADGKSRRWHRDSGEAIDQDWSQEPWFKDYLEQVKISRAPAWRAPIFTDTISSSTLLHDVPLEDDNGNFIGILSQIVPIQDLSYIVSRDYSDTGVTPFVLYDRKFVLAHPAVASGNQDQPLVDLEQLGDLVLARIWAPDEEASFISAALVDIEASGIYWGDDFYLFLHRDITHFGPAPWTIGVYLNTSLQTDNTTRRLLENLLAGLAVLLLAIIAAVVIGRKVSSPVQAIVSAADSIESGNLDTIEPLRGSNIRELDDASNAFNDMVKGLRERELIRDTLGRFVPEEVAGSLLAGGGDIEVLETEATILFCDIEAFTRLTELLGPVKIVAVLNAYFSEMVDILEQHGGIVTQFQGDAILATFNVPVADEDHARHAVESAQEMLNCVKQQQFDGEQLNIRIGINTGKVVAGAIGARGRLNYTVHGDAVNLAARLESMNKEYGTRLMVSASTVAQVPDFDFSAIGELEVRGQSQAISVFTLASLIAPI